MLPFWKLFGNEKHIKIDDEEKGMKMEVDQKEISGNYGSMKIKASFTTFTAEGNTSSGFANLLSFFNPWGLGANQNQRIIKDNRKAIK